MFAVFFSTRTTLLTGLIMAPDRLSHRVSKVPANMKMTSTGRWTTGVHVNMANVTFSNGSGSARPTGPSEPGCPLPHPSLSL